MGLSRTPGRSHKVCQQEACSLRRLGLCFVHSRAPAFRTRSSDAPGHTQASWVLPCLHPRPQPLILDSGVPSESQNEWCLEVVLRFF